MLQHKAGQDFIGKFRYALTTLPGKNNAHTNLILEE